MLLAAPAGLLVVLRTFPQFDPKWFSPTGHLAGFTGCMAVLPIRTERLLLRIMRPGDAAVLAAYRDDPDIARYQEWSLPFTLADAERMLAGQAHLEDLDPEGWTQVAIEHDGEVVGDLGVCLESSEQRATLGYTIAPSAQHRGFAAEAAGAMVDAVFARTDIWRIVATADDANRASMRVIEPLGFRFEGIARKAALVRGEWVDDVQFAITRDDRAAWVSRVRTRPERVELVELFHETARPYSELRRIASRRGSSRRCRIRFVTRCFPRRLTGHGRCRGSGASLPTGARRLRDARSRDGHVSPSIPLAASDRSMAPAPRHRRAGDVDADRAVAR